MDERNQYWIYPDGFDPGGMEITSCATAAGAACAVESADDGTAVVVLPEGADPAGAVTLGFRATIPERFGAFGSTEGVVVLGGGWHPLAMGRGADGTFDSRAPIERADYAVTLHLPSGVSAVVDGRGPFRCDEEAGCRVENSSSDAEPPSVVVGDEMHVRRAEAVGIEVVLVSPDPAPAPESYAMRPGRDLDSASLPDLRTIDHYGRVLDVVAEAIERAERLSLLPPAGVRPERVAIVVVPTRLDLTVGVEGAVLLSDRAYELFPLEWAVRFHDREVIRAVLTEIDRAAFAGRPLAEARWSAETAAAATLDAFLSAEDSREQRAEDVLRYGAFLPVIDQMIFAPLMEFRDAYYPSVEETD